MRLADIYDAFGEISDERITSGSSFYVRPDDNRTRRRIEILRTKGYEIKSVGACRFRCTSDPISDTLKTDGSAFYNNAQTMKERYRLSRKGFGFRKLRKGVFVCCKRPKSFGEAFLS